MAHLTPKAAAPLLLVDIQSRSAALQVYLDSFGAPFQDVEAEVNAKIIEFGGFITGDGNDFPIYGFVEAFLMAWEEWAERTGSQLPPTHAWAYYGKAGSMEHLPMIFELLPMAIDVYSEAIWQMLDAANALDVLGGAGDMEIYLGENVLPEMVAVYGEDNIYLGRALALYMRDWWMSVWVGTYQPYNITLFLAGDPDVGFSSPIVPLDQSVAQYALSGGVVELGYNIDKALYLESLEETYSFKTALEAAVTAFDSLTENYFLYNAFLAAYALRWWAAVDEQENYAPPSTATAAYAWGSFEPAEATLSEVNQGIAEWIGWAALVMADSVGVIVDFGAVAQTAQSFLLSYYGDALYAGRAFGVYVKYWMSQCVAGNYVPVPIATWMEIPPDVGWPGPQPAPEGDLRVKTPPAPVSARANAAARSTGAAKKEEEKQEFAHGFWNKVRR